MSSPSPDWHGRDRHGRNRGGRDRRGSDWAGVHWAGADWSRADWSRGDWAGPGSDAAGSDAERRPTERRQGPVRIGDAERDQAVSLLSDHFVAGRLTQTEFEERSEQATRARYVDDLAPLFDDLPSSAELQLAQGPWSSQSVRSRRRTGPPPFVMLAPFLMIGLVITAITLAAPWLLWGMFWIMLISGASRRRWYYHNHQNR